MDDFEERRLERVGELVDDDFLCLLLDSDVVIATAGLSRLLLGLPLCPVIEAAMDDRDDEEGDRSRWPLLPSPAPSLLTDCDCGVTGVIVDVDDCLLTSRSDSRSDSMSSAGEDAVG